MKLNFVDPPELLYPGEKLIPSLDVAPAIPSALTYESWDIFKNSCITNFYYIWIMEQIEYKYNIIVKAPATEYASRMEKTWDTEHIDYCRRTIGKEPFAIFRNGMSQQLSMLHIDAQYNDRYGRYVELQLDHPDFEIWAELAPDKSQ